MKNNRKIKISKIEHSMQDVSAEISTLVTLIRVLFCVHELGEDTKERDLHTLFYLLEEKITSLRNDFTKIEQILRI